MENLLEKCHSGIIAKLHSIQAVETPYVHPNLQFILTQHQAIFNIPRGLPPSHWAHDHSIPLVLGILSPNVLPYHHPFTQKNEIEKKIQELLKEGVIHLSIIPYSYPMVMVLNKECTWCMCPDFHSLNKIIIKDKFPIHVIDDLLDELSGA